MTGATDGIGKAYAFELARRGFNIVLVSRTQSKLNDVKKELNEKFARVRKVQFDFKQVFEILVQKITIPRGAELRSFNFNFDISKTRIPNTHF